MAGAANGQSATKTEIGLVLQAVERWALTNTALSPLYLI
jgi:hypothetical protein